MHQIAYKFQIFSGGNTPGPPSTGGSAPDPREKSEGKEGWKRREGREGRGIEGE